MTGICPGPFAGLFTFPKEEHRKHKDELIERPNEVREKIHILFIQDDEPTYLERKRHVA